MPSRGNPLYPEAMQRRRERLDAILKAIEVGETDVDGLAARFGVSKMTIHRDLDELEQGGLLRKVRGGASIQSTWPERSAAARALASGSGSSTSLSSFGTRALSQ